MLSWEDDDLLVDSEIRELGTIFEKSYNYEVERWLIPREKPATRIHTKIGEFLENDGTDTLLIVYYAGHAIQDIQQGGSPIWIS